MGYTDKIWIDTAKGYVFVIVSATGRWGYSGIENMLIKTQFITVLHSSGHWRSHGNMTNIQCGKDSV